MATLTFLGAVDGVTGSMYLLKTISSTILLDCGLFQGRREEEKANKKPLPFSPSDIDAVVLSHAHLDHSGRLPLLVNHGYEGPIYMTLPTLDLIEVMLNDAASLQLRDVEWENKRRRRSGKKEIDPLYTQNDVEETLRQCQGVAYHEKITLSDEVSLTLHDAGHILGLSLIHI